MYKGFIRWAKCANRGHLTKEPSEWLLVANNGPFPPRCASCSVQLNRVLIWIDGHIPSRVIGFFLTDWMIILLGPHSLKRASTQSAISC